MKVETMSSAGAFRGLKGPGALPVQGDPGAFSALLDRALEEPMASEGRTRGVDKTDKLYEQCEALEGFLVKSLLTGMRKTVQKTEFLSGGFAGEVYEDMLYDEYAKDLTKQGGFGLAELAYLELTGQRGLRLMG